MGRGRRFEQWQQLGRRFSYRRTRNGTVIDKERGQVARIFRGEFNLKVDAKGRVSIPASFRRVLEAGDPDWREGQRPKFIIMYGDHRRKFLECFSMEAINEVDEQILALPRGSEERRVLERMTSGQSHQAEVDEDGRIVLPPKAREKIALDGEAVFVASSDTFQIWKPETYEAESVAETEAYLDQLPKNVDALSLLSRARGE